MAYQLDKNSLKESTEAACAVDRNFASPIGFRVMIEGEEFDNLEYSIQTIALPSISSAATAFATPSREVYYPGDRLEYDTLSFTFLVDETYRNYREIHDWLFTNTTIENALDRKTRDILIMPFTSHNNVSVTFRFADAFPTSLSSLEYDVTATDIQYLTATVDLSYSYYKFE